MCSCEFVLTAPWVFPFCVWWLAPTYPESPGYLFPLKETLTRSDIRGAPHTLILGQALIYSANGSDISKDSDANLECIQSKSLLKTPSLSTQLHILNHRGSR